MTLLYQILSTLIICYISTTMSILYILPSSTYNLFKSENTTLDRIMTETELSFMGSISSASTLIVTPFCGYLLDTLGRKGTLILFYLPQLLGWGLIATVFRVEVFIFSMFLCGLSGCIYLIAPVYISEYCDPSLRGAMASSSVIFHGVGMMMSYLLGGILDYNTMNYTGLTMAIVCLLLICLLKESPLYLMKRGFEETQTSIINKVTKRSMSDESESDDKIKTTRNKVPLLNIMYLVVIMKILQEAAKSIAFYKGIKCNSKEVIKQMAEIRRILRADKQMDSTLQEQMLRPDEYKPREKIPIAKYMAKSRSTRRALVIINVIFTSSLFQGLIVVEIYAKPLFEEAVPSMTATLSSVMFGIITVCAGLCGAYLIDTAGRRVLLIVSSVATGLLCVILGTQIQFSWGPNWLSAILLYFYSITYSVGPAIVPTIVMGEVFLPEIKSFAVMVSIEWAFMCMFSVIFIANPIFSAYGLSPLFYIFASFSFFTAVFSYIYLPETKGLPVDVIQQKFMQKKNLYT